MISNKKKLSILALVAILLLSVGYRGETKSRSSASTGSTLPDSSTGSNIVASAETTASTENGTLVAYFSCTGTTERIAGWIAEQTGADLYRIIPEIPYTSKDLNYWNSSSRATVEQNSPSIRPSISGSIEDIEKYDTVFLGYPLWWGQAPKIIYTLLENYDFTGKTIVSFCTSHSSGIGSSDANLHRFCGDSVNWMPGKRFSASTSREIVTEWIDSLDIHTNIPQNIGIFNFNTKTVLLNSGHEMPLVGLGTYSLLDEVCVNSVSEALKACGRLIDTAHIYNNEESVGQAVRKSGVPREEIFITTKLYMDQYDHAEEAIEEALRKLGVKYVDLMLLHHPGAHDVEAYKAMERAVEEGKIRSIGLSNYYVEELEAFANCDYTSCCPKRNTSLLSGKRCDSLYSGKRHRYGRLVSLRRTRVYCGTVK